MRRFLSIGVILLMLWSVALANNLDSESADYGQLIDFMSSVAMQCKYWNTVIGSALGENIALNEDNLECLFEVERSDSDRPLIVWDDDGIIIESDVDGIVRAARVKLYESDYSNLATFTRAIAIASVVGYEVPMGGAELSTRFDELFHAISDGYMKNAKSVLLSGEDMKLTLSTPKGKVDFYFVLLDGGVYFSTCGTK